MSNFKQQKQERVMDNNEMKIIECVKKADGNIEKYIKLMKKAFPTWCSAHLSWYEDQLEIKLNVCGFTALSKAVQKWN